MTRPSTLFSMMLAVVAAVCLFLATTAAFDQATTAPPSPPPFYDLERAEEIWQEWLVSHGKAYANSAESHRRFLTFRDNLALVNELNRNRQYNDDDAVYDVNQFSDMTIQEFRRKVLMQHAPDDVSRALKESQVRSVRASLSENELNSLPDEFDWRDVKGVVGAPRNQGLCGSCWAFSASANIESVHAVRTGRFVHVSPQQMVECDARNCQCYGGWMHKAYEWVIDNGGIAAEGDYPYCVPPLGTCIVCNAPGTSPKDCPMKPDYCNTTCRSAESSVKITGWEKLDSEDEDVIAAYLIKNGPLAIAVNANWWAFYRSGISNPFFCSGDRLNHAVLLVGFGQARTAFGKMKKYWIISNSWGEKWGENGYIRLARGNGKCGCNRYVVTAKIDE